MTVQSVTGKGDVKAHSCCTITTASKLLAKAFKEP